MRYNLLIYDKFNSITNTMLLDIQADSSVHTDYIINFDCYSKIKAFALIKKSIVKSLWLFRKFLWIHNDKFVNIIITNEAAIGLNRKDIYALKKRGKRLIALLVDPLNATYLTISKMKNLLDLFDEVYTFDPLDAQKYGYKYTNQLYSMVRTETKLEPLKNVDLFYIGHIKDRQSFIEQIINQGIKSKAGLRIILSGARGIDISYSGLEYRKKRIPYPEVINMLSVSKCILDITQEGQSGITLRYYEAVVYNKKLLTNNVHIKELPFYNEKYMRIYKSVNEIDWGWVMNDDKPEYNYDGRFSPVHLLKRMNNEIN